MKVTKKFLIFLFFLLYSKIYAEDTNQSLNKTTEINSNIPPKNSSIVASSSNANKPVEKSANLQNENKGKAIDENKPTNSPQNLLNNEVSKKVESSLTNNLTNLQNNKEEDKDNKSTSSIYSEKDERERNKIPNFPKHNNQEEINSNNKNEQNNRSDENAIF